MCTWEGGDRLPVMVNKFKIIAVRPNSSHKARKFDGGQPRLQESTPTYCDGFIRKSYFSYIDSFAKLFELLAQMNIWNTERFFSKHVNYKPLFTFVYICILKPTAVWKLKLKPPNRWVPSLMEVSEKTRKNLERRARMRSCRRWPASWSERYTPWWLSEKTGHEGWGISRLFFSRLCYVDLQNISRKYFPQIFTANIFGKYFLWWVSDDVPPLPLVSKPRLVASQWGPPGGVEGGGARDTGGDGPTQENKGI